MSESDGNDVSLILKAVQQGNDGADERLFERVYHELRRMAHGRLAKESSASMATGSMVNEAYLRLVQGGEQRWENRRHFFGAAARAMRQIVIDRARKRKAVRHGGDYCRVTLDENVLQESDPEDVIALHEAMDRLQETSPRAVDVVKYRYFLGLTVEETAELLEVSPRTVSSDWELAKAWLRREISRTADQ